MSSFFGFNVAVSGLLTSQRALDVVNHNVANAATIGYSRQIAETTTNMPMSLPNQGMLGTGSNIYNIARVRDEFLDYKYWSESPSSGQWGKKVDSLNEIQIALNDSGNGFATVMDKFYTAINSMITDSSNATYRGQVVSNAGTLTKTVNSLVQKVCKEQKDIDSDIAGQAGQINSYAKQIATLNRQIYSLELDGHTANDLRDQRTVLIDNLAKIVNINVNELTDPTTNMKKMIISIGDTDLVNHIYSNEIAVQKNAANTYPASSTNFAGQIINTDLPYKTSLTWKGSAKTVDVQNGILKGLIDSRDGDGLNGNYKGAAYYIEQLDSFANEFAKKFNTQNNQGYTLGDPPAKANDFFVSSIGGPIKAATFAVSKAVQDNPNLIGASDYAADKQSENTGNLKKLYAQKEDAHFFAGASGLPDGKPEDFLKSVLSGLAIDIQQAKRMNDNQTIVVNHVDLMRKSVSSVDQNEEAAKSVMYTQTYQASAHMINVMDGIYDTIINRLGLVGR